MTDLNSASPSPLETFESHRKLLFGIAYRMLGGVADAEDMVQETFLKWRTQDHAGIRSARAWLTTTVSRLCLDELRSARVRREEYFGIWLPEPLLMSGEETAGLGVAARDSINPAVMMIMEALAPEERAVFILREVFDYDYAEISTMLEKSEAACRQMCKRARDRVAARDTRFNVDPRETEALVGKFMQACATGDLTALLSTLAPGAISISDGGGVVPSGPIPIRGADKVARLLLSARTRTPEGATATFTVVNGLPGLVLATGEGAIYAVVAFELAEDGRIGGIYAVTNPNKLRGIRDKG